MRITHDRDGEAVGVQKIYIFGDVAGSDAPSKDDS
jgi:hypothetical protein